jgi:glycosyltransferase involved in cell wall biosynthesis
VVFDGVIGVGYAPARWLGIPSIGYLQESVSEGLEEAFYSERLVRRRLRTAARCIAISQYVKRFWSAYCDAERIEVVPNGLDERHVWLGQRLYSPDGVLRVTIAGSIISHKGQLCLVRALSLLEEEEVARLDVRMYGARDESERGAYEREVREYVRDHGLGGVVSFHPYSNEIASVWRDTDIVVVASHAEGFGLVTAEAMASGCVVVGTDSGATHELLGEGRGILFSFDDPQDLARALREAADRVSEAHAGEVTPAMRFARGFTAEAQTQAVLRVIREACESSAGEAKSE